MPNTVTPEKGSKLSLRIQDVPYGGIGETHDGALTYRVPYVQTGELVEAEIRWIDDDAIDCNLIQVLEPVEDRVAPACAHFGLCGGCKLQQLTYESQVQLKLRWVTSALTEIAGCTPDTVVVHRSEPFGYRIKAALKGRRTLDGRKVGYCRHRNFQLVPIRECPILCSELQELIQTYQTEPPFFPRRTADIMLMWGLDGAAIHLPGTKAPVVRRQVGEFVYELTVRNFFQINQYLIQTMIAEALGECEGGMAVDLYCGVGLYTLFLAQKFEAVTGVESNGASVKFLKKNCATNNISTVKVLTGEVETIYPGLLHRCIEADLLVVNPPRAGMMPEARAKVIEFLRPRRIHYISCNPQTLARDVKEFIAKGYRVTRLAVMDVFPQTGHVESAVQLLKSD